MLKADCVIFLFLFLWSQSLYSSVLFRISISSWFSLSRFYVLRDLSISSRSSTLLACNCSSGGLLCSVYFCSISYIVSFFIYDSESFHFCLSVLFIYSKNSPGFVSLSCFWSLYFIYTLIFVISSLPRTLGFVILFLVPWVVKLGCLRSFLFS